jgi:hypothetical protein
MSAPSYPVPKPLWDALENVLAVKSKSLIKDIAKTLNQPEKPLLEAFKARKHSFHLVDMNDPTDDKFECEALVCQHAVAHRCRKPVLFGKTRCPDHEFSSNISVENKLSLRRVTTETGEIYFVDSLKNIYTADCKRIGFLEDTTAHIFEIEEEEEYS